MGDDAQQEKFLSAVKMACRIAKVFNAHGVRKYGVIRIDSAEFGIAKWRENPKASTARIVDTFKKAAQIAADNGERLAAEGEICWAGMHSWKDMLDVLEGVGMPNALGFQARTTKPASTAALTIPTASSTSPRPLVTGSKTPPPVASSTSAGMAACSRMPCSKRRTPGTRSSPQ